MTKVIIVTGVSRGIGKAIVKELMKTENDAVVYGIARSEEQLKELKSAYPDKFYYVAGDITNAGKLEELVSAAISRHGRINSVIANAGVLEPVQDVNHLKVDAWKKLFDINFFSIVSLTSIVMPYLSEASGDLILVSSGASCKPYYAWGAYGASKAALNHFAMTVAQESPKVKAIAVAPGVVDTQMQDDIRDVFGPESMTPEALKRFEDLKKNRQLLHPSVPAVIYSRLALSGIPASLNGEYLRYNDERLKS